MSTIKQKATVPVTPLTSPSVASTQGLRQRLMGGLAERQVQQVLGQAPLFIALSLLCGVVAVSIYWERPEVSRIVLAGWATIFGIILALRSSMVLGYRINPVSHSARFWDQAIIVNALAFGSLWGYASLAFNMPELKTPSGLSYDHRILFAALVACQGIAALAAYAANFRAYLVYILSSMLPGILGLGLMGGLPGMWLGGMCLGLLAVLVFSGHRIHIMNLNAHLLQSKNETLIQVLEQSKHEILDANQKLAMEIYDRTHAESQLQEVNENLERNVRQRTLELSQLNHDLAKSKERLTLAIDAAGIGLWDWDLVTDAIHHSNFEQLLGYSSHELKCVLDHLKPLVHPSDFMGVRKAIVRHLTQRTSDYHATFRIRHKNGRWIWVEDKGQVIARDADGHPLRMLGIRRDVSLDRQNQDTLRLSASVFDTAAEGIFILDDEFRFLAINPYYNELTGFTKSERLGQLIYECQPNPSMRRFYLEMTHTLRQEGSWQGEFTDYRKDGSTFPQWLRISTVRDDQSTTTHYVGLFSDLTARKEAEERLTYLSNYDKLTGFANRNLFRDRLHAALKRAREVNSRVALMFMDLDRFKQINDTLGHEVGDELLKEAAQRISRAGARFDTVARLGGDEFTMILENYHDRSEIENCCEHIIGEMRRPFRIGTHELLLGSSIGISVFPENGRDLQMLLNHADIAMHQAKRTGGNTWRFYTEDLRVTSIEQVNLETQLRKAIFRDEFIVHYQPKMCLKTNRLVGVEALVRWNHPTMGLLVPREFMPLAEESGLVSAISEMVLDKACRQIQFWREAGLGNIKTSVNIAAHQLRKGNLLQIVNRVIDNTGVDPHLLEFELTESTLMEDAEGVLDTLFRLRNLGIALSLDDFGTGYSSLSYLKRFPIDILKIDQAFIRDIGNSPDDEAITRAIIAMAHSLNMKVVAEGVETAQVMEFLRTENCDIIQGFFISKPVPESELYELLRKQA